MNLRHTGLAGRGPEFVIPYVTEETGRGERTSDVYSRLLRDRIIFLGTGVNDQVANAIVAQLLFLAGEDPKKEISMYINSPRWTGLLRAGDLRHDAIHPVRRGDLLRRHGRVDGLVAADGRDTGQARGIEELADPDPPGVERLSRGAIPDIEVMARETLRLSATTLSIMAKHTGQDYEKIQRDTMRDYYMTAQEAKEYGIIDTVVGVEDLPDNVAAKEIAADVE